MSQNIRATWRTRELLGLLLDGETHGYRIAKATGRPNAAVYTSLKLLTEAGWVESHTEPNPRPNTPERRVYRLTLLGRLHAERLRDKEQS